MLRGVAAGFTHLRRTPPTRTLVLALLGLNLAVSPALALGLALRAQEEGWGPQSLGVLHAVVGLGAVAGALIVLRRRPRREVVLAFCLLVLQGLAIIGLGLGSLATTALACALIGITAGAASAVMGAVFVAVIDGDYLGRMVAITRLGDDVLMPASMVGFGWSAGVFGVQAALVAYGAAMAVAMLLPLTRSAVRRLSTTDAEQLSPEAASGARDARPAPMESGVDSCTIAPPRTSATSAVASWGDSPRRPSPSSRAD